MDEETKCHELTSLYNEYKDYFTSCELKLHPIASDVKTTPIEGNDYYARITRKRRQDKGSASYINLKTIEGAEIRVSVDASGWFEIPNDENEMITHYETFESLMMQRSKGFQDKFGTALSNRLNTLISEKIQSEEP